MSEPSRDDYLDERARQIAADACSGKIDAHTARMEIVGLIFEAKVMQFVADATRVPVWERDELETRVHDNLIERVLDEDAFSLETASHSSVIGWARQEGFRKSQWALGEIRRERRKGFSVPTFEGTQIESDLAIGGDVTPKPNDEFLDLAEGFSKKAKGTRERGRSIIAARTLLDAFRLPNPIIPAEPADREWIVAAVNRDHELAHRALVAFHHLIDGSMSDTDKRIDQRLLALWDDYSYEQIELLVGKTPLVCRTIVAAACSRRPRPNKSVVSEVRDTVILAAEGEGWADYAADVVETWLARECETFSEFVTPSDADAEKARQIAAERSSTWDALVAAGERYGFPMGKTPEDVTEWVSSVFDSILSYPTSI